MDILHPKKPKEPKKIGRAPKYNLDYYMMMAKQVVEQGMSYREAAKIYNMSHGSAARWLVDSGITKNTNCASSISSVCLRKPCTTGYGFRKKAYGYDWRFTEDI